MPTMDMNVVRDCCGWKKGPDQNPWEYWPIAMSFLHHQLQFFGVGSLPGSRRKVSVFFCLSIIGVTVTPEWRCNGGPFFFYSSTLNRTFPCLLSCSSIWTDSSTLSRLSWRYGSTPFFWFTPCFLCCCFDGWSLMLNRNKVVIRKSFFIHSILFFF